MFSKECHCLGLNDDDDDDDVFTMRKDLDAEQSVELRSVFKAILGVRSGQNKSEKIF